MAAAAATGAGATAAPAPAPAPALAAAPAERPQAAPKECGVCCDVMKGANLELTCQHCAFSACANCYKRVFEDATKPPACMSPECRKILSADNLLQAFSAAYVTTGLEKARREALVRADGGFELLMQMHVFPRVHDFDARCADFTAVQARMHQAELAVAPLEMEFFDFKKKVLMRQEPVEGSFLLNSKTELKKAEKEIAERVRTARHAVKVLDDELNVARHRVLHAHRLILAQPLTGEVLATSATGATGARPRLFQCSAELCSGNWLSSGEQAGNCMVCKLRHCARCAATVPAPAEGVPAHVCNPDDVATMKEIATSTRECPRCHASIMRSSGCDQMMCTSCHCVFDWRTGAEARGVIHNPHFHALGVEERQRILDEREGRGIVSTREDRFIAGAGPRRVVPACDEHAEMDPECEPFDSRLFTHAIDTVFTGMEERRQVRDLYRLVLHYENDTTPGLQRQLASEMLGEQGARMARLERMRGYALEMPVRVKGGHPLKHQSQAWLIPPRGPLPSESNYKALLMRLDTERTKAAAQLQFSETFVENGKALIRLLLAATPTERPAVLAGIQRFADETQRLSKELSKKPQKRKTVRVLPPPKRPGKRKRAVPLEISDGDEPEDDGDDDDDEEDSEDEPALDDDDE